MLAAWPSTNHADTSIFKDLDGLDFSLGASSGPLNGLKTNETSSPDARSSLLLDGFGCPVRTSLTSIGSNDESEHVHDAKGTEAQIMCKSITIKERRVPRIDTSNRLPRVMPLAPAKIVKPKRIARSRMLAYFNGSQHSADTSSSHSASTTLSGFTTIDAINAFRGTVNLETVGISDMNSSSISTNGLPLERLPGSSMSTTRFNFHPDISGLLDGTNEQGSADSQSSTSLPFQPFSSSRQQRNDTQGGANENHVEQASPLSSESVLLMTEPSHTDESQETSHELSTQAEERALASGHYLTDSKSHPPPSYSAFNLPPVFPSDKTVSANKPKISTVGSSHSYADAAAAFPLPITQLFSLPSIFPLNRQAEDAASVKLDPPSAQPVSDAGNELSDPHDPHSYCYDPITAAEEAIEQALAMLDLSFPATQSFQVETPASPLDLPTSEPLTNKKPVQEAPLSPICTQKTRNAHHTPVIADSSDLLHDMNDSQEDFIDFYSHLKSIEVKPITTSRPHPSKPVRTPSPVIEHHFQTPPPSRTPSPVMRVWGRPTAELQVGRDPSPPVASQSNFSSMPPPLHLVKDAPRSTKVWKTFQVAAPRAPSSEEADSDRITFPMPSEESYTPVNKKREDTPDIAVSPSENMGIVLTGVTGQSALVETEKSPEIEIYSAAKPSSPEPPVPTPASNQREVRPPSPSGSVSSEGSSTPSSSVRSRSVSPINIKVLSWIMMGAPPIRSGGSLRKASKLNYTFATANKVPAAPVGAPVARRVWRQFKAQGNQYDESEIAFRRKLPSQESIQRDRIDSPDKYFNPAYTYHYPGGSHGSQRSPESHRSYNSFDTYLLRHQKASPNLHHPQPRRHLAIPEPDELIPLAAYHGQTQYCTAEVQLTPMVDDYQSLNESQWNERFGHSLEESPPVYMTYKAPFSSTREPSFSSTPSSESHRCSSSTVCDPSANTSSLPVQEAGLYDDTLALFDEILNEDLAKMRYQPHQRDSQIA